MKRVIRLFSLVALIAVATVCAMAQAPAPPLDNNVKLAVSIANGQSAFHIGEKVPLLLEFSSEIANQYQLNTAQYDRSGRLSTEQYDLYPKEGFVDPLAGWPNGFGGGLTGFLILTVKPWSITFNLNEWVRFTQPGEYRLTVTSHRVGVRDANAQMGVSPVLVRSNEVRLKIVPATAEWQRQAFDTALKALGQNRPTNPQDLEVYDKARREAIETLRFLGTADAAREMAKRMRGDPVGGLDYACMLGLFASPQRDAARSAMANALKDPDQPIDQTFVYALRMLKGEPGVLDKDWREHQKAAVTDVVQALPSKRGQARWKTLATAVSEAWNTDTLPPATMKQLIAQVVANFEHLSATDQNGILEYRWDKLSGRTMLPVLKKLATSEIEGASQQANDYTALQVRATALRRWYELDPESARTQVIAEIERPHPRFDARVLGILPDKTLPEVDAALAEHFAVYGDDHLASLIARYATGAILPQVLAKEDPDIGKQGCAVQNPILAYVLRVNSEMARPRIEQALASKATGCNHSLFQDVSDIYYNRVIEEIGIKSFDHPDGQVAMTAATMLGKHGSPVVEPVLLRRYRAWAAQWTGHESELNLRFGEMGGKKWEQLGLGENLAMALATGNSWLYDRRRLTALMAQSKVKPIQDRLGQLLKLWDMKPLVISVIHYSGPNGLGARVVQYEYRSMNELEAKLEQFPAGTEFSLAPASGNAALSETEKSDLRTFLAAHHLVLVEGKSQP